MAGTTLIMVRRWVQGWWTTAMLGETCWNWLLHPTQTTSDHNAIACHSGELDKFVVGDLLLFLGSDFNSEFWIQRYFYTQISKRFYTRFWGYTRFKKKINCFGITPKKIWWPAFNERSCDGSDQLTAAWSAFNSEDWLMVATGSWNWKYYRIFHIPKIRPFKSRWTEKTCSSTHKHGFYAVWTWSNMIANLKMDLKI